MTAKKVLLSFLAILVAPFAPIAVRTSTLWKYALLPATRRKIPDLPMNQELQSRCSPFTVSSTSLESSKNTPNLEALFIRAKGMTEADCLEMPVVVLFCPNEGMMQDQKMQDLANEYNGLEGSRAAKIMGELPSNRALDRIAECERLISEITGPDILDRIE